MARIFGFLVGIAWTGLTLAALRRSLVGWSAGQTDVGFWWAVITALLAVATVGAFVGTWMHTGRGAVR